MESSPPINPNIHCPRCSEAISEYDSNDDTCWKRCFKCNGIFPNPVYCPDEYDMSVVLPFEIVRSENFLELNYPSNGLLAKCTKTSFVFWVTVIYLITFVWGGVWIGLFVWSAFLGNEISHLAGYFMAFTLFAGLFCFLTGLPSLFWNREMIRFNSKGMSQFAWGLFMPYGGLFVLRRDWITLRLKTYESRNKEISYNLYLDSHSSTSVPNGESHLIYDGTPDKNVAAKTAHEIVSFLKSLPCLDHVMPTEGILDKQLHDEKTFFSLYCPACRKRHIVKENDFSNCWKRYWFQCHFCNHQTFFPRVLFLEDTLPPEHKTNSRRWRNRIILPGEDDFWKERLSIRTKSHVRMFSFWSVPYLVGIIGLYLLPLVIFLGAMTWVSFTSGDFRPIYHSIPLTCVAIIFTVVWVIPKFIRYEFCHWKLNVSETGAEYSFGIWNETVRRRKDLKTLQICRRNRDVSSIWNDEPMNPAYKFPHAVVLYDSDQTWGEIPCRDENEVDRVYEILEKYWNEFTQNNENEQGIT